MADYQGVLADLRERIAKLDSERKELETAVAAIQRIVGSSFVPVPPMPQVARSPQASYNASPATETARVSFRGLTMPQALARHYDTVNAPQTVRQIVEALRVGGFAAGQNLRGHVYNTLHRLQAPNGPYVHGENGVWSRQADSLRAAG